MDELGGIFGTGTLVLLVLVHWYIISIGSGTLVLLVLVHRYIIIGTGTFRYIFYFYWEYNFF